MTPPRMRVWAAVLACAGCIGVFASLHAADDKIGVETYWPWGVSVGDVNADGWDDIFVTAGTNFPFRYGINSLLLNNHGANFLDSEFLLGIEPRRVTYKQWFVTNCSQPLGPSEQRICEGYNTKIMVMAPKASRSSVIFDLDNDGAQDIVTNDFNSEPQVLWSKSGPEEKDLLAESVAHRKQVQPGRSGRSGARHGRRQNVHQI